MMKASMALHCGLAKTIAIVHGNNQRSAESAFGGPSVSINNSPWNYSYWSPWGLTSQGALYAMLWNRYMHVCGGKETDLGAVAVAQRKFAMMNPLAIMRKPLSIDDYAQSRYITWPLHLYDYCLVNDDAHAMIVTTRDNAKNLHLKHPPVYLMNFSKADANIKATSMAPRLKDFYHTHHKRVADDLYGVTGLNAGDIDAFYQYDSFSVHIPLGLEGFGFCPYFQGLKFIQNGTIEPGGKIPVNTNGGHLSDSYTQGWTHQQEIIKQLRGEAGERQVPNMKYALYNGDATGKVNTLIYRRD